MEVCIDILLISVLVIGVVLFIINFIKIGREKQLKMISEWLLLAVVQAEKELGGGTGKIKLRYVYDMFIAKFKVTAMLISFDQFSIMVDSALDKMKDMLSNNEQLYNYITQPKETNE